MPEDLFVDLRIGFFNTVRTLWIAEPDGIPADVGVAIQTIAGANQVAGQKVGRELDGAEGAREAAGQRLGKRGLADAGYVLDQNVAAAQQRDFVLQRIAYSAHKIIEAET